MSVRASIDFDYNHPLAAGILAVGADDSVHVERMIYKRKLSDAQRKQAIQDLIGDTKLDIQVADSEDPLAIDTLNQQLGLKLKPVVKGAGSVGTAPVFVTSQGLVTEFNEGRGSPWEQFERWGSLGFALAGQQPPQTTWSVAWPDTCIRPNDAIRRTSISLKRSSCRSTAPPP